MIAYVYTNSSDFIVEESADSKDLYNVNKRYQLLAQSYSLVLLMKEW